MRLSALVLVGVVWLRPAAIQACSFAAAPPLAIDPGLKATDQSPPSLTVVSVVEIKRGRDASGCGGSVSSCDDLGVIRVAVAATDDMTAPEQIGFRVAISAGDSLPNITVPQAPVTAADTQGEIVFVWIDGRTDDQEEFNFELDVVAIDRAGNESAPRRVQVADGGSGCSVTARRRASALSALAIVSLVLAALARGSTRAASRRPVRVRGRLF